MGNLAGGDIEAHGEEEVAWEKFLGAWNPQSHVQGHSPRLQVSTDFSKPA